MPFFVKPNWQMLALVGMMHAPLLIGTAGWSLPKLAAPLFPGDGSHLQRYAARFPAVEINSTFYRPHRPSTFARWAESTPEAFRFSVKLPKTITHQLRLQGVSEALDTFLSEVDGLGEKLGCMLVQLPPSLAFDRSIAEEFFATLRDKSNLPVALEPRHASWFSEQVDALLVQYRVSRVAADPACVPAAADPGGYSSFAYVRLHGSPRTYYSHYDEAYLSGLAARLATATCPTWCIFDNTALGAATLNAAALREALVKR